MQPAQVREMCRWHWQMANNNWLAGGTWQPLQHSTIHTEMKRHQYSEGSCLMVI